LIILKKSVIILTQTFVQKQSGGKEKPAREDNPWLVDITQLSFFQDAISTLSTLVVALGAGLAVWGVINLLEGYGNDNPGAKSQGIKQLMSGGGVILIGLTVVPLLSNLFG